MNTLIVSDIDGVLANTQDAVIRHIWEQYRVVVTRDDMVQFDLSIALYPKVKEKHSDLTLYDFSKHLRSYCWNNSHFYHYLYPFTKYWAALQTFYQRHGSGSLMFLTGRPSSLELVTKEWLTRLGFVSSKVVFSDKKDLVLEKLKAEHIVYVEDRIRDAMQAFYVDNRRKAEKPDTILDVYLRSHTWNSDQSVDWSRYGSKPKSVIRAGEDEIASVINSLT